MKIKLGKSWLYAIILLSLYSCGSYTLQTANKGSKIKSILAVTVAGDTVSVPYNDFIRERYDTYTRFNYNNNWYWNNWRYDYSWRWNQYWFYNNGYYNNGIYFDGGNYSTPIRPKVKPRNVPRPQPGVVPGVVPKPLEDQQRINIGRRNENQINRPNTRTPRTSQGGNNGWISRSRQVVPSQPARPTISRSSQPGQIRGGSRPSGVQQSRGRSSSSGQRGGKPIDQ